MKNSLILIVFLSLNLSTIELPAQTPEADSLQNLLDKHITEDSTRVKLLNEIVRKIYLIDIDKAIKYALEAKNISFQIKYEKGIANSYVLLGVCYQEKSDYVLALSNSNEALRIFEKLNSKTGLSTCYTNMGLIFMVQGDYAKALEFFQKSLLIDEELGDTTGISTCYTNIGNIYYYEGDYVKALEFYQKSLKIDEALGDRRGISYLLNNIGLIYQEQKDYPEALAYYMRSVSLKKELALNVGMADGYYNIGSTYQEQGDFAKAYEYYQKSLESSLQTGEKTVESNCYLGLASLYLEQGKAKEAYSWAKKAYALANKIGELSLIKGSSELLAECSYILGKYKDAYQYHVIFKNMNDSLFDADKIKKITGLEYQYKYEKEKREAELERQKNELIRIEKENRQKLVRNTLIAGFILMFFVALAVFYSLVQKRKTNRVLALQQEKLRERNAELFRLNKETQSQAKEIEANNQTLKELNATKDKFFSIIAHDLRSPFNALLGFSEILLQMHNEYDNQEREKIIKTINKSIVGAYKLLENLLTWSLSQSGRMPFSPQKLNLNEALNETMLDLRESAHKKNIEIINTIPENEIVFADKNMITTVFRNLISNAIKFTHSNQHITLSMKSQKDSKFHEISVKDTGVGIPKERIDDLFRVDKNTSTAGTNNEKGTGLGLIICKEFIEKHGGEIWIESEINMGTTFSFLLPNKQIFK